MSHLMPFGKLVVAQVLHDVTDMSKADIAFMQIDVAAKG
jgi:hypothetical protein